MYWAEALANQEKDQDLKRIFSSIAKQLKDNEEKINEELIAVQGQSVNIGGYYKPTEKLVFEVMRPSKTLNNILSEIK